MLTFMVLASAPEASTVSSISTSADANVSVFIFAESAIDTNTGLQLTDFFLDEPNQSNVLGFDFGVGASVRGARGSSEDTINETFSFTNNFEGVSISFIAELNATSLSFLSIPNFDSGTVSGSASAFIDVSGSVDGRGIAGVGEGSRISFTQNCDNDLIPCSTFSEANNSGEEDGSFFTLAYGETFTVQVSGSASASLESSGLPIEAFANVPLPASGWALLVSMGMLVGMSKRRRS